MASLQFVKLNLDMIALNIQSLENTSDRNEALDMLTHVAQALEKSNQMETVFQNHKNQPLTSANGVTPQIPTWSHKQRASVSQVSVENVSRHKVSSKDTLAVKVAVL